MKPTPQILTLCFLPSLATQAQSTPFTTADLVGEWTSDACGPTVLGEDGESVNLMRTYSWSETNFVVRYAFHVDAACEEPLFAFVSTGPYELGRARPELGPVREATVFIESMYYVAQFEAGRDALGTCGEHLEIGRLTDVTETGCGPFPPRSECLGDHELFRVEDGVFHPGLRTPDMCAEAGRPPRTQDVGARRR